MLLGAFEHLAGAVPGLAAFCLWEEFAMTPLKRKGGKEFSVCARCREKRFHTRWHLSPSFQARAGDAERCLEIFSENELLVNRMQNPSLIPSSAVAFPRTLSQTPQELLPQSALGLGSRDEVTAAASAPGARDTRTSTRGLGAEGHPCPLPCATLHTPLQMGRGSCAPELPCALSDRH